MKRIASLVTVTNELREGKYTVRTPIVGKDEIAQLQKNFNAMADELFTLSKAEVGQETLQKAPCDIHHLVQLLVDSYAPLAWRTNKIEIVAEIPDEVPLVSADKQRLE